MAEFSPVIHDFWQPSQVADEVTIVINSDLAEDRRFTLLTSAAGRATASMTPAMAGQLTLQANSTVTLSSLREVLAGAGVDLHGADCLFYFTEPGKASLLDEATPITVRRLDRTDASAFKAFEAAASEQDRDDAYVELDHWAIFGSFEHDRIVAAASSYPWGDARLADIGVLTLPEFRGKGHARAVVRALSKHAYRRGYEPQYRCQLDNHASRATATSAGLTLYGTWECISSSVG